MADSTITVDLAVTPAAFRLADDEYDWKAQDSAEPLPPRWLKWKDASDEKFYALQARATAGLQVGTQAEAVSDADFAASAGWDATDDTIDQDTGTGTIARFSFAITAGASVVAAPQTVTLTWPTELATAPQMAIVQIRDRDDTSTVTGWEVDALSTTIIRLRTIGNPVDAVTETVDVLVVF